MDAYLTKPFEPAELVAPVARLAATATGGLIALRYRCEGAGCADTLGR